MFLALVVKLVSLLYVYAVFNYAFNSLVSYEQTAFTLLLPVLKLIVKNWIDRSIVHAEDLRPEMIIFNVEIFHALNVAFSMQNATSRCTIVVLIVLDCFHAFSSIRRLTRLARSLRDELQTPNPSVYSSFRDITSTWRRQVVPLTADMTTRQPQLLQLVLLMFETDLSILDTSSIRLKSSVGSQQLSAHLGPRSAARSIHSDSAFQRPKLDEATRLPSLPSPPNAVGVAPLSDPIKRRQSIVPERGIPIQELSPDEKRMVVNSLSQTELREKVEHALQLLHMTEFFVLVEYTEVMIPLVYCLYLLVMSSLPNRVYYAQLKELNDDKLRHTIVNVLLYAFLELLSFLVPSWFLAKKLLVSSIHLLAFVLETQWQMVQAKLILWVVLTVQSSLEHFGADYSFQFKWFRVDQQQ